MLCYVDYTCGHSYRAWRWLTRLGCEIGWRTFSLKEVNRGKGAPSAFEDASSLSVLALALAHAAREHDLARYNAAVFEAFHERRIEEPELLELALEAGVDTEALDRGSLIAAAASEHAQARARWGVFGTPTLILDDAAVFLRLRELPDPADDDRIWSSIQTMARSPIALLEIQRPEPGAPLVIPTMPR